MTHVEADLPGNGLDGGIWLPQELRDLCHLERFHCDLSIDFLRKAIKSSGQRLIETLVLYPKPQDWISGTKQLYQARLIRCAIDC